MKTKINKVAVILLLFLSLENSIFGQGYHLIAKTDSTKIIHRKEKFKCPDERDTLKSYLVEPLPYYCFYSSIKSFTINLDSSKKEYYRDSATYYFDDSSNYFAYKLTYKTYDELGQANLFDIDEIKDSLRYLSSSIYNHKRYICTNLKSCNSLPLFMKFSLESTFEDFTKSGKTKIIYGYLCSEYISDDSLWRGSICVSSPFLVQR